MTKLIFSMIVSLNGYTEDKQGQFGWGAPEDEAVHTYINELSANVGTYLYGRKMYDTMVYWEMAATILDQASVVLDGARQWTAAEKVVLSRTPTEPCSARTRVVRESSPEIQTRPFDSGVVALRYGTC